MSPDADPYRTLGLTRGASLAEVKKAYRRLVKANHPDAAGEAALPRFLAIQEAYDQIVGPGASAGPGGRPAAARRPWDADPDRANATHRAYGGRARRTRTGGPRRPGSSGSGTDAGSGADGGSPPPPRTDGADRPPNKATLGSTSYDGAEAEPFEPDWGGASWYGTTSGTYWTLNPKEYADPRKHGPEYQARARRAAAAARDEVPAAAQDQVPAEPDDPTAPRDAPTAGDATGSDAETASPPAPPPPTHTTSSWWDATAGPAPAPAGVAGDALDADEPPGGGPASPDSRTAAAGDGPGRSERPATDATARGGPVAGSLVSAVVSAPGWAWLEGDHPGLTGRVARAVLGWVPIAIAVGWFGGELTGCGRFSAACDGTGSAVTWLLQVALLAVFLLLPRLASPAAIAGIAAIGLAIPGALILSAPGTEGATAGARTALGVVVLAAWVVGLGLGVLRAVRRAPERLS